MGPGFRWRRSLVLVLLLPAASLAAAQDLPRLKSGLWEMSNSTSSAPGVSMRSTVCLDASVQRDVLGMSAGMMQTMCSKRDLRVSGNRITGDLVCKMGDSTIKSRSVMTLRGDTAYRTEARATFDPPFAGMAQTDTVIEGRYVGACKPGQKPGDMTTPTGQTINIRTMMSGAKAPAPSPRRTPQ
jgi:hypothetical protein